MPTLYLSRKKDLTPYSPKLPKSSTPLMCRMKLSLNLLNSGYSLTFYGMYQLYMDSILMSGIMYFIYFNNREKMILKQ